jgi:RNA polymerase sigma-70 factor, ECF subfamily
MGASKQPSDEELMRDLAAGNRDALEPLHRRYAPLILSLASRSLERAAAQEIVQEVFLTIWREAATFDPERGGFRPWVMQITRFRVVSELRRRSRRPIVESDPEGQLLDEAPDQGPQPVETVWRDYRRSVVQQAFEELPFPQRQALGLAFFEDLTHEQVAAVLNQPLGTTKTRIRAGLQKLRGRVTSEIAAVGLVALLAVLGLRYRLESSALNLDERALSLVTMSDTSDLKLTPVAGGLEVPRETHARYRGRPGAEIAVVTVSHFPPVPAGYHYQVWALERGLWTLLGTVEPDASGSGRMIVERGELATLPEAVRITREPTSGSSSSAGEVVVAWPAS